MLFQPKMNSLIFLAGPSGAGKSTLAKQLSEQLKSHDDKITVQILSSDDARREILGRKEYHNHDPRMLQASKQAFELLHQKCDLVMQWPLAASFVIVDATNLSEGNRKTFQEIARRNHYSVSMIVLDYKNRAEYEKHLGPEYSKKVIHRHIKALRERFYPNVKRRDFTEILKIRTKDFTKLQVEIPYLDLWSFTWLPDNRTVFISDIHGCFTEFKTVLTKLGYRVENNKLVVPENLANNNLVLLGDLIDKGPESKEVIDFVYENLEEFTIVTGNHENFVYKWFQGKIDKGSLSPEMLDNFFTLTHELKPGSEHLRRFNVIHGSSLPFVRTDSLFASHAPCHDKYLGKIDPVAMKHQRNFRLEREFDTLEEANKAWESALSFWKDSAVNCYPFHFAGHLPLERISKVQNKYLIDGGCANGGFLNYAIVEPGYKVFTGGVPKETPTAKPESRLKLWAENKRFLKKAVDLDIDAMRRLRWCAKNKVNFISGTMSPVDKNLEKNVLESFEQGLNYYRSCGLQNVVLQRKYMGSRANAYVCLKEPANSYMASRNGFKIRRSEIQEELAALLVKQAEIVRPNFPDTEWVILDGELLPWSALGKGLIEQTFKPIGYAIEQERDLLVGAGFESLLSDLYGEVNDPDFLKDVATLKRKDLVAKYGQNLPAKHKGISEYRHIEFSKLADPIKIYQEQIELYGQDHPLEFKGFSVLKTIGLDGSEKTYFDSTNDELFRLTGNTDPCLVVDLNSEEDLAKARAFYEETSLEHKMEGVVIKPQPVFTENVAPYLKARNPNYLTITYGYDYLEASKYEKLVKKKSIRSKVKTSIIEFEIGKRMLEIPRAEISLDNEEYCDLVAQMINQIENEAKLDPRL